MKFSTRQDIEAPIENVFDSMAVFENYERAAMRRGAIVYRKPGAPINGLGAAWDAQFSLRGKMRDVNFEVVRFERPRLILAHIKSSNLTGQVLCELTALSKSKTRMSVTLDFKPMTFSARLLIQSLKLGKTTLTLKFKERVAELSKDIEDRFRNQA